MVATDAKLLRGITASVIDAVFETSPDWVFVKDLDHRFQYGNPTFLRFLGLTLEEVIGKTSPELGFTTHVVRHGSKPDETGLWADDEEVISSGKAQTFRGKSLYWRGEWVYFNTDKFPLKENDGKVIGVLGIARMTTDLVKVKTELHKMDQQVHSLQKSMDASAIVAVTDIKGKILEVNDNFCRISKYGREELMGKDHRILNSGFHGKEFFADMWNTILSGRPWSGEVRNRAKDGTFYWVFTTITPEHDDNGAIDRFVSIRFEITKQKHFEEDLEKQRLYLVHSEKMSSIGEVCAGLAHEINNPLTIIAGNIDKLQEELGNPAVERDAMKLRTEKIAKMVSRINKIIKALRSIARDGAGDPFERTSLRSVLDETLDLCGERFRNYGVKVEVDCPADVFCDCRGVQISQVLLNLLINAYDAIQNLPERWIKVKISAEGEDAVVCVVDSGKGLSPEIIQKLMRPFFTTKPQGKGVGLGLSISKGIVEQHHGRLAYCGKGPNTCFQFRLPLKQKT